MASIENLEILVDVDIASAIASLEQLQGELADLAQSIESTDVVGSDGVDVKTDLESIDDDLALMQARIEAAEQGMSLDVPTDIDPKMGATPSGATSRVSGPPVGQFIGPRRRERSSVMRTLDSLADKFREVRGTVANFDLRMSDMHNMMARLIPLLLVFIGAIPAVVTALVGLAAAAISAAAGLAALGGLGALGVALEDGELNMDNLSELWEDLRSDFIEAFAPLAERLEPLFRDGIEALGTLFQQIANEGDALMELTDEARAFGNFVMDVIPGTLRNMAATVEAMAPLFAQIGAFFEDSNILRSLVQITMEAMPALRQLLSVIMGALPHIARMSVGFAQVSATVAQLVSFFYNLVRIFGFTDEELGLLIGSALALSTAIALLNSQVVTFALRGIALATIAMYNWWMSILTANTALSTMIYQTVVGAVSSIYSFITSLILGNTSMLSFAASTFTATGALAAFLTLATIGGAVALVAMATSAAAGFLSMASGIDSATASMKEFDRVSGRTGSGSFNPYAPDSGAGDPRATSGGGGDTTINVESSGDAENDRSNARYASWRQGRTTGGNP